MSGWWILLILYAAIGAAAMIWDAVNAARRREDESLALSFAVGVMWPIVLVLALIPDGEPR